MFDIQKVVRTLVLDKNVATGYEFEEEGMCCVRVLESGQERVKPSAGATGESFSGYSVIANLSPKAEALIENNSIPVTAPFTFKLVHNDLVSGQLRCIDNTTGNDSAAIPPTFTFIISGVPTTNEILVDYSSGILTFHSSKAGHSITIHYRHEMTVRESITKYLQRNQRTNIDPEVYNMISVFADTGIIYTDQYDINKDYSNVPKGELKTGPGGKITTFGGGDPCGSVISVPSIDYPYLGVSYTVRNL